MNLPIKSASCGFTLFELLAVLVVAALVLATVLPYIGDNLSSRDVQSSARQLLSAMRLARSEAVRDRRPVDLFVDVEKRYYKIGESGENRRLPQRASVILYTARSLLQDNGSGAIRFFPDGSASGGRVTLSSGDSSHRVDVNWLTGAIKLTTVAVADSSASATAARFLDVR